MQRRGVLGSALGALVGLGSASYTTPVSAQASGRRIQMTQLVDVSADQQDLSRDYSTGWRLALADLGRTGKQAPQLQTLETDGSPESLRRALQRIQDDKTQLAVVGTVGERLASASIVESKRMGLQIAHLAPWLATSQFDADKNVFPLFASRDAQIQKAVHSLAYIGIKELGLVYPTPLMEQQLHQGIAASALKLGLQTVRLTVPTGKDAATFGRSIDATSPAVLLFLGGTVDLALFSQGLGQRGTQRYVICLSDVDVTTLMQLGVGKSVPLVLTQVVPNPHSSNLSVVMAYRAALKRFFDEAPSPVSLAGYIAGRYMADVLGKLDADATRAMVLSELQRGPALDVGGFRVDFSSGGRGSSFVNQMMLQGNGKLIG